MQFEKNLIFLRKSIIFNKGRYSRTRQIVRGTFFFSILLNVNVVFGALALYYLYTVKLSYIWWLFYILMASFTIPSFLRRTAIKFYTKSYNLNKIVFIAKLNSKKYVNAFYKVLQNQKNL